MRILVLSRTAWRKDNSFGNTYSNLFGYMRDVEIANIYLGNGIPDADNRNVVAYYRISEKEIVNRIARFNIGASVGKRIFPQNDKETQDQEPYDVAFQVAKKNRWSLFFVLRELIWRWGKVDYAKLRQFIDEFKPDIVFLSFYYAMYVDRIALYIKKFYDIPMVLEAAIDIYSMKQISIDPLFWINRICIRKMIRRTVAVSEKLYVISDKMQRDYSEMLGIPCSVLYKAPDMSRKIRDYKVPNEGELIYLYTGNISSGRWKTLAILGKRIMELRSGKLAIYTSTPITTRMNRALQDCEVHPAVSSSEVIELQNNADILVHVESFGAKDRLEVRYAISTKIMDYISAQRCILALGPRDVASMEFLSKRNLAICIYNEKDIETSIRQIESDRHSIIRYVNKVKEYVENSDTIETENDKLRRDLEQVVSSYHNNSRVKM